MIDIHCEILVYLMRIESITTVDGFTYSKEERRRREFVIDRVILFSKFFIPFISHTLPLNKDLQLYQIMVEAFVINLTIKF